MNLGLGLGIRGDNNAAGGGDGTLINLDMRSTSITDNAGSTVTQSAITSQEIGVSGLDGKKWNNTTDYAYVSNFKTDKSDLTGNVTVSFWINVDSQGESNGRFFTNGKFQAYLGINDSFRVGGGSSYFVGPNGFELHRWNHIVITKTAAGVCNVYVNGASYGSTDVAIGSVVPTDSNLYVGCSSVAGNNCVNGFIDKFKIDSGILDSTDILALYNSEKSMYVTADKSDIGTIYVSSSYGNDTTGVGSLYKPYATLAKAELEAVANDVVCLYRGDSWAEDFRPTAGDIKLIAYGNGGWTNYPVISGAGIYGYYYSSSSARNNMLIEGIHFNMGVANYAVYANATTGGGDIEISRCKVTGSNYGLRVVGTTTSHIHDCIVDTAAQNALYMSSTGQFVVEDNDLESVADNVVYLAANSTGSTFRRNRVVGGNRGISFAGNLNVTCCYNVFDNIGGDAIRLSASSSGHRIFNNTFNLTGANNGFRVFTGLTLSDIDFYNNIVHCASGATGYFMYIDGNYSAAIDFDDNCYWHADGTGSSKWYWLGLEATFAGWEAASGDTNSIEDNPDFAETTNYTLETYSPCIDQGLTHTQVLDFLRNTVPINLIPDIGANEEQS